MARQSPSTPLQVSARRFTNRRMMHALVRRDVAMHDDPLRAQSLALSAGGVLGTIAVAACTVLALIRPQGLPDAAPIVMARDSGALYVRIGDLLHPVLNLASARLIARSAVNPAPAGDAAIANAKRGPLVGIPGAPARIAPPVGARYWTVCDDDRTVVSIDGAGHDTADAPRAVLATPRGESAAITYLLYEGRRARVDLRDVAAVRALRLDGVVPVPVSRTLLDVLPEGPALEAPRIDGVGGPGPASLGGARIGAVVRVLRADTVEHYVVLADGVQSVGEVTADLVEFAYDRDAGPVPTVAPAVIASTPMTTALRVGTFPQRARTPVGAGDDDAVCVRWDSAHSTSVVAVTDSARMVPTGIVTLAQADGDGPNVDAVVLPAGRSTYVQSASILGADGATGPRFLVDDSGVVFGVHDADAATFLGLGAAPDPAPWPILAKLPRGPELSTTAASVLQDGLAAPS